MSKQYKHINRAEEEEREKERKYRKMVRKDKKGSDQMTEIERERCSHANWFSRLAISIWRPNVFHGIVSRVASVSYILTVHHANMAETFMNKTKTMVCLKKKKNRNHDFVRPWQH